MIQLYGYDCPQSIRVKASLELKNLDYEMKEVDPFKENKKLEKLNPLHQIPVLKDKDGTIVFDSFNIVAYLDTKYPEFLMYYGEPKERNEILKIVGISNYLNNILNDLMKESKNIMKIDKTQKDIYKTKILKLLNYLNKQLGYNKFFVGENFSLADSSILGSLYYLRKLSDVELGDLGEWLEIFENYDIYLNIFPDQALHRVNGKL